MKLLKVFYVPNWHIFFFRFSFLILYLSYEIEKTKESKKNGQDHRSPLKITEWSLTFLSSIISIRRTAQYNGIGNIKITKLVKSIFILFSILEIVPSN